MATPDLQFKFLPTMEKTRAKLSDMTNLRLDTLLGDLGAKMLEQNRDRLDNLKQGPDGKDWPEWSDKYKANNPKGTLLEKSRQLLDSLEIEQGPDAVSVGSDLLYAVVHLLGSEKRNIPARPFLGFSDENMEELTQIATDFLASEMKS